MKNIPLFPLELNTPHFAKSSVKVIRNESGAVSDWLAQKNILMQRLKIIDLPNQSDLAKIAMRDVSKPISNWLAKAITEGFFFTEFFPVET